MNINNFVTSGFFFTEEEYELKLQYFMLNSMLSIVSIIISIMIVVRILDESYSQAIFDIAIVAISILSIFYLRYSKKTLLKLIKFLLFSFYILVMSAFIKVDMHIVGASWFIVLLLPSFYLLGLKGGVFITVVSFISIVTFGYIKESSYNAFELFYIVVPMLMASIFTYMYEKKVTVVKELLKSKNITLENKVDIITKEEQKLVQENSELADLISKSNIEFFVLDFETDLYLYANKGGLTALGYTLNEMLDLSVYDINPTLRTETVNRLKKLSKSKKNIMNISQHKRKDGSGYGVQSFMHSVTYKGKKAYAIYDINLTDQQEAQSQLLKQKEELLHKAYYDELTKLPNRTYFNDKLVQAMSKAKNNKTLLAIIFIDLDGFKEVNDTLGHNVGDAVLCEVSNRFKNVLRKTDTISRFGGDEFVCIIEDLSSCDIASTLAQKLLNTIREPMNIHNQLIQMRCSIGISIYPDDADNITQLLHYADTAMYEVKDSGKNDFRFYTSS